ncbi:HEAT repeat domain-containing protein [Sorangium sp. So ce693]|uniref:HEAT repeat domain-containing protein n=1 Tax=Sorangium sp. So ce693 TaxID=3133318 RepID=UPI003F5F571F
MSTADRRRPADVLEALLREPQRRALWHASARALMPFGRGPVPAELSADLLVRALDLRRPAEGYDEKLYARLDVAHLRGHVARALGRMGRRAAVAVPVLVETLREPLGERCSPMCCSASSVRHEQILARVSVLDALRRLGPQAGKGVPADVVAALLAPASRRIALSAAELLARHPESALHHRAALLEALEHPYAPVVEAAARGLSRAAPSAAREAVRPLTTLLRHEQGGVRRAAIRALVAMRPGAKGSEIARAEERFVWLAERDPDAAVRAVARRALGSLEGPSGVDGG